MRNGTWVVCFNSFHQPTTWGQITAVSGHCATVRYGEQAPIWGTPFWDLDFIEERSNEQEAQKFVEDYEQNN